MQNYLFKIFYFGKNYQGFQRQPNGMAIENFIEFALIKSGLIGSFSKNRYRGCSRTDAGVNAIGNTFTIKCKNPPDLIQINSHLPKDGSILIWSCARVQIKFNPRNAKLKIYSYMIPISKYNSINDIKRIHNFEGTHNFSNFIKKDGAGNDNPVSEINKIEIKIIDSIAIIEIKGNKFGREQIRRMIGFILENKYRHHNPFNKKKEEDTYEIKPAPPFGLILNQIEYNETIKWKLEPRFYSSLGGLLDEFSLFDMQNYLFQTLRKECFRINPMSQFGQ